MVWLKLQKYFLTLTGSKECLSTLHQVKEKPKDC